MKLQLIFQRKEQVIKSMRKLLGPIHSPRNIRQEFWFIRKLKN